MLSKQELTEIQNTLRVMKHNLKTLTEHTLTDFGEDDGFDYLADGLCESIYDAHDKVEDALGAVTEVIENIE